MSMAESETTDASIPEFDEIWTNPLQTEPPPVTRPPQNLEDRLEFAYLRARGPADSLSWSRRTGFSQRRLRKVPVLLDTEQHTTGS